MIASFDLITVGRSSVDLYGQQIGSCLEDVSTFMKAIGGCPTNIAIGTRRLGLRSSLVTRVGDEHMGRLIREQLAHEGVALAIDHHAQLEAMADAAGGSRSRIDAFKTLAVDAAVRVAAGQPGFGMLLDGTYGREALFRVAGHAHLWIARPVERPGSRPLDFETPSLGAHLAECPRLVRHRRRRAPRGRVLPRHRRARS